jgi:acylphosphatase
LGAKREARPGDAAAIEAGVALLGSGHTRFFVHRAPGRRHGYRRPVIRRRVIVHGAVQGVGFRYSAARTAGSRRVAGWIRNRPDGTVEAVFEGDRDAVEWLVDWCRVGPRGAAVDELEVRDELPEGLQGFAIR